MLPVTNSTADFSSLVYNNPPKNDESIRAVRIVAGALGVTCLLGSYLAFKSIVNIPNRHETDFGWQACWYRSGSNELLRCDPVVPIYHENNVVDKAFLSIIPLIIGLASCCFGLVCCVAGWTAIEYDNPHTLAKIRKETLQKPLKYIVEKHGFENIFKFEIIHPSNFEKLFHSYALTASFKELVTFHKDAKDHINLSKSFNLPSLVCWKDKFFEETKQMRCDEILKNYSPLFEYPYFQKDNTSIGEENSSLFNHPLLSRKQLTALKYTQEAKSYLERQTVLIEEEFILETWDAHKSFGYIKSMNGDYHKFIPNENPSSRTYSKSEEFGIIYLKEEKKFLEATKLVRERIDAKLEALKVEYEKKVEEFDKAFHRIT